MSDEEITLEELQADKMELEKDLKFVTQQIEKLKNDNKQSNYVSELYKDYYDDLMQLKKINIQITQMDKQDENDNNRRLH